MVLGSYSIVMKFFKKSFWSVAASEFSDKLLFPDSVVSETIRASESNESVTQISDTVWESSEHAMIQVSELNKDLESKKICDSENQKQTVY